MLSLTHRFRTLSSSLCSNSHPFRSFRTDARPSRRHSKPAPFTVNKPEHKSEWWAVDGEMHEIGDNVPPRERFIIPRENLPNRRRKQLREQFMRRTRLVLKESVSPFSFFFSWIGFIYNYSIGIDVQSRDFS